MLIIIYLNQRDAENSVFLGDQLLVAILANGLNRAAFQCFYT